MSVNWSDDRVSTLSRLWLDGLSASQVAKALGGVTRNAVIGKIHRLGLSGRAIAAAPTRAPCVTSPRREVRAARPAPLSRRGPRVIAATSPVAASEEPGLVDNLAALAVHACKWPIGDPKAADFTFCGRHAQGRYCAAHERLGVRPGPAWRVDRDPIVRRALATLI